MWVILLAPLASAAKQPSSPEQAGGEETRARKLTFYVESVNTLNVFFLFPGYVCFGFLGHWTPNRQKIYRAKFFVFFGAGRIDTEFQSLMSILFLRILLPRTKQRLLTVVYLGHGLLFALTRLFR